MFETAITVLRVRGVPLRLHISLLLFIPYLVFVTASQFVAIASALDLPDDAFRLPPLAWGGILGLSLFVSIVIHELAHTAVALASGARVRSITLMMLGGVTMMETEVPPEREAWMAFAGPLASFALALGGFLVYRFAPLPPEVLVGLLAFSAINASLGVFNLLPAFPLDGGRVLRGLLVRRMGQTRATRVATTVGRVTAVAIGLLGVLQANVILVLIAAFIYFAATAERVRFASRDALRGVRVGELMNSRLDEASVDEDAGDVARRLLARDLVAARVVRPAAPAEDGIGGQGETVGVVTAEGLVRRAAAARDMPVGAAIERSLPELHAGDDAAKTVDALARGGTQAVIVRDEQERIVGVVTPREIERALALGALR